MRAVSPTGSRLPTSPIYLDYHATTPVDRRVFAAMAPYFTTHFGNPHSRHAFGWQAEAAVAHARGHVAKLIGARPEEIVFTSGATESNNLAIKGLARSRSARGGHVVTVATEHHAVLDPCRALEHDGFRVTYLPVDGEGRLDLDRVAQALSSDTLLISVMAANNETGVLQDMPALGRLAREHGVALHTDAAQAVGKIPVDVRAWQVDLLSISGHKMYGPKGIGALYVRREGPTDLAPQMEGGGQERGLRSGTLNVPGIVGLGEAAMLAGQELAGEGQRLAQLRDRLRNRLVEALPGVRINGSWQHRLPHNLNVSFEAVDGDALMMGLQDLAVSSSSACRSGDAGPSYVLQALGVPAELAQSTLRFGLGRFTSAEEIDRAAEQVIQVVRALREVAI